MVITDCAGYSIGSERRVEVCCDICNAITTTTYANYRNSQVRRGNPGTTYCRSCICKISAEKRRGKPAHNKGKPLPDSQKGCNHVSWKGGRYISSDGYVMVYVGGDKKRNGWQRYKKEHMLIAEKMLGRKLKTKEVVHHIDGNKTNNDETNLWVTTQSKHRDAHVSLQAIGFELLNSGLVVFDRIRGVYILSEKFHARCND